MNDIPDKSIDMILCDLPYGSTKCRWDLIIPFEPLWIQYERIIKDNGAIVLFGTQPFTSKLVCSNLKLYKYEWIYEKTQPSGHLNAKKMPMRYHENILVFYKKPPTYNPIKTFGHNRKASKGQIVTKDMVGTGCYGAQEKGANYDSTERYPKSIQCFSNGFMKQKSIHPTQKPVELCEYFIKTYTNKGDTVLDNCFGSNTTGVACVNIGRRYIGIEKDEAYFKIGKERMEKAKENKIMEDKIKELEKWVKNNYDSEKSGWTAERSYGNYDDCFEDGMGTGSSMAAYEVGIILGMDLEKPEEPDYK